MSVLIDLAQLRKPEFISSINERAQRFFGHLCLSFPARIACHGIQSSKMLSFVVVVLCKGQMEGNICDSSSHTHTYIHVYIHITYHCMAQNAELLMKKCRKTHSTTNLWQICQALMYYKLLTYTLYIYKYRLIVEWVASH